MTSEEINFGGYDQSDNTMSRWLREIAYQLAVMNERAALPVATYTHRCKLKIPHKHGQEFVCPECHSTWCAVTTSEKRLEWALMAP